MEKKLYLLILEKGCADCAIVLSRLDIDKIVALEDNGSDTEFHVSVSFTNNTTEELLNTFGVHGKHTPVLMCPDGSVVSDVDDILKIMDKVGVSVTPRR